MSPFVRRCFAESVGTFIIVFAPVALSAAGAFKGAAGDLPSASWVSGLAVLCMIYTFGHISKAHFNPAVTIAFAVGKCFPWREVPGYIAAQITGAVAAAGLVAMVFGAGYGTHIPHVNPAAAFVLEMVFSALLMLVIIAVATDKRAHPAIPGLAIGLVVVVNVYIGGALTGGSMNPARSLAPALFAGGAALSHLWIYLTAPVVGAIGGALTYNALRGDECCATEPEPTLILAAEVA